MVKILAKLSGYRKIFLQKFLFLDAVEMIAAIAAFVVPDGQIPAGVDPHMLAAAFRTPKPDILQDLLLAGLPPPTVRLLWQLQVRQIVQKKGSFHESGIRSNSASSTRHRGNQRPCFQSYGPAKQSKSPRQPGPGRQAQRRRAPISVAPGLRCSV